MTINLDTQIIIPETVYTQEVGEETILLDTQGGHYFSLDPVGTRMWQLMRQHGILRPAYETLLNEYDVTPERLETDLLALVEKMLAKGLASLRPAAELP
ncbi:MAG: PqqD family protein [Chloroflexi bacterium HGW-Chloroflexi-6]|nr:MAG: PqqD family protein [Chloroflexi bacterium HGW-Chloroflexi-6]